MKNNKRYYETYVGGHVLNAIAICRCYKIRYIAEYVDDYSVRFNFLIDNKEEESTAIVFLGINIVKTV